MRNVIRKITWRTMDRSVCVGIEISVVNFVVCLRGDQGAGSVASSGTAAAAIVL